MEQKSSEKKKKHQKANWIKIDIIIDAMLWKFAFNLFGVQNSLGLHSYIGMVRQLAKKTANQLEFT
jgi:hypothetical protein